LVSLFFYVCFFLVVSVRSAPLWAKCIVNLPDCWLLAQRPSPTVRPFIFFFSVLVLSLLLSGFFRLSPIRILFLELFLSSIDLWDPLLLVFLDGSLSVHLSSSVSHVLFSVFSLYLPFSFEDVVFGPLSFE